MYINNNASIPRVTRDHAMELKGLLIAMSLLLNALSFVSACSLRDKNCLSNI